MAKPRLTWEELKQAAEEMGRIQLLARDYLHVFMTQRNRADITKKLSETWTEILDIYESPWPKE